MKRWISGIAGAVALSTPLMAQEAQGDAAAGETQFGRQCVVCHVVRDPAGEVIAGSPGGAGPNLYEVVGATPGSQEDFSYSASLKTYGETGAVWDQENFTAFIQDPTGHLRDALDDSRARSKMSYRLRGADDAQNIYAYLAQYSAEGETSDNADAADASVETSPTAETEISFDIEAGEDIYQASCRNCHGPSAKGMASFPKLAGKDFTYLASRLEQYKAGETVGPNSALMMPVAADLSDADIANVAGYISTTFE